MQAHNSTDGGRQRQGEPSVTKSGHESARARARDFKGGREACSPGWVDDDVDLAQAAHVVPRQTKVGEEAVATEDDDGLVL